MQLFGHMSHEIIKKWKFNKYPVNSDTRINVLKLNDVHFNPYLIYWYIEFNKFIKWFDYGGIFAIDMPH